jgi:hypothetical protein
MARTTGHQLAVATLAALVDEWRRVLGPDEYRELVAIAALRLDRERRRLASAQQRGAA